MCQEKILRVANIAEIAKLAAEQAKVHHGSSTDKREHKIRLIRLIWVHPWYGSVFPDHPIMAITRSPDCSSCLLF
ncbi:MAG TPA: hypothetical protein VKU42_00535, partial [Candidatus Angelobacter sp.]|nr:hypothetical protein [Candidatus Angelobacter sp.]